MEKERHKIVPASYLVLIKENKILLSRRFNTGYQDGKYSLVAGHVDKGETFTKCLIREAKEEVDISVKPEDLKVAHIMQRDSKSEKNNERVDVFFLAEKWDGTPENREPHKCDDLSWFNLNEIPENTIPYIKQAVECIKNKIFYSEHGFERYVY